MDGNTKALLHTPLPWQLFDRGKTTAIMGRKFGKEVVHWTGFDSSHFPTQAKANAEFIITACNSYYENKRKADCHDELLDIAKEWKDNILKNGLNPSFSKPVIEFWKDKLTVVNAAISRAESDLTTRSTIDDQR